MTNVFEKETLERNENKFEAKQIALLSKLTSSKVRNMYHMGFTSKYQNPMVKLTNNGYIVVLNHIGIGKFYFFY